jgi:hypothetical protein
MNENNPSLDPYEDLLAQIADLLKVIQKGAVSPADDTKIPPGIIDQLAKLESNVARLEKMGEDFAREWRKAKSDLKSQLPLVNVRMSRENEKVLERANQLKAQIEEASQSISDATERYVQEKATDTSLPLVPEPKFGRKRRKKFKRFGGDSKWRPL